MFDALLVLDGKDDGYIDEKEFVALIERLRKAGALGKVKGAARLAGKLIADSPKKVHNIPAILKTVNLMLAVVSVQRVWRGKKGREIADREWVEQSLADPRLAKEWRRQYTRISKSTVRQ